MSTENDSLDEHLDELFHFGADPKIVRMIGEIEDFDLLSRRLVARHRRESPLAQIRRFEGGIMGAIIDHIIIDDPEDQP